MFLKKLLILACFFGFSTILLAAEQRQQYDYLNYTINVENNSGMIVDIKPEGINTNLSAVTFESGGGSIETNGVLPIANAKDAVNDPSGGATWNYLIHARDDSFLCQIQVTTAATEGAVYTLKTSTTVFNSNSSIKYCKLNCEVNGCSDSFGTKATENGPHSLTYTLSISKP